MTIFARLRFDAPSADLSFRKRFRLFFIVATVVLLLSKPRYTISDWNSFN